ncbi:MAG: thiamine-phosphate kinase [Verrucomicrobiae bacterium]|nr:thiamine-phosphate kinase [Verrucomicrobiae bacterium]
MTELELIQAICQGLPTNPSVVVGPGDDCAVLELGLPDRFALFKTDAVVEGVHFTPDAPPAKVGHKALARCLSDVAAMAGTPTAALITLGLPKKFDPSWVLDLYAGINALAARYAVAIAGGETTLNPDRVAVSVAIIGWVQKERCVLRSGAQPGDAIFVTGELGGSIAGKHLEFEPRLVEAQWLTEHFKIHAMIDLSDGLASDLRHVLNASRVGAELLAEAIPISHAARIRAREAAEARYAGYESACQKTPLQAALTDGEDFELLFTVAPNDAVRLLDAWRTRFPELRLSCIGKIVPGEGITIRDKHGVRRLTERGYIHFA